MHRHLLAPLLLAVAFFSTPSLTSADPGVSLVSMIAEDIGQSRPGDCPSRWCACYLERVLAEAGLQTLGSNKARDFASYGQPAEPAQVGSIMVMRGHVGVVSGSCEDGSVQILSGNHGNRVGVGCYSAAKAIAWRAPVGAVERPEGKRRTLSDLFSKT